MCTEDLVCFVGFRGLGGLTRFRGFGVAGGWEALRGGVHGGFVPLRLLDFVSEVALFERFYVPKVRF